MMLGKNMMKGAMGLTTFGIATGVGISAVKDAGGDPTALGKLSQAAVPVGSLMGATMTMGALDHFQKAVPKMKKGKKFRI